LDVVRAVPLAASARSSMVRRAMGLVMISL
jgi:hypothetical protein